MTQHLMVVLAVFALFLMGYPMRKPAAQSFEDYRIVQGWKVHYESGLAKKDPEKLQRALDVLEVKLAEVRMLLPKQPLETLQEVEFWISANANNQSTVYHPSAEWLRRNQRNPKMAGGIQLQNVDNFFITLKRQPMAVLHELAHAWHHRVSKSDQKLITKTYQNAIKEGLYQNVTRYGGAIKDVKAYAITNEKEYFAELSEAYFGMNDYFPYNRMQLEKYDPQGYAMMQAVWK